MCWSIARLWSLLYPTVLAGGVVACASRPATTPPVQAPIADAANALPNTTTARRESLGTFSSPGDMQYDVQLNSSIELMDDSVSRRDSTEIRSILSISFTAHQEASQILATVHTDSTVLRSNTSITPVLLPSSVAKFAIDRRTGHLESNPTPHSLQCTEATTTAPLSGIEVLPTIPPTDSDAWTDTTRMHLCRGAISVTLIRVATYVASKKASVHPQQVVRTNQVTISGSGSQWSQQVELSGSGTGTDTLSFSNEPPRRLEQVSGMSTLELTFRSPFRIQRFSQATTLAVSKRSP